MKIPSFKIETPRNSRGFFVSGVLAAMLSGCALTPPESAIACAVDAARADDRDAFAACFTPRSRAFLGTYWSAVGENQPELLRLGAGDVRIETIRPLGDADAPVERALAVLREGGRDQRVVLHHLGGRWRIDLLDTRQVSFGLRGL